MKQHAAILTYGSIVLFACIALAANLNGQSEYTYDRPENLDDGWITATLEDVGMDTETMEGLMDELISIPEHDFHSILVVRNNKLVFEEYFQGQDADLSDYEFKLAEPEAFGVDDLHFLASATKSITSILTGIAIDKGYLEGIHQKLFTFFPEYSGLITGRKKRITLYHLLTMSSGMLISEDFAYSDPRNELNQLWHSPEPVKFALEKALVARPGKSFIYNSGNVNLLGEVIRRSTGMALNDFAGEYLFKPLGINKYEWIGFAHDKDMAFASTALYLHPRDMAKIGQLCLQEGIWSGDTIVSPEWIRQSTGFSIKPSSELTATFHTDGYGFLWWLEEFGKGSNRAYSARGHGLQFIVVLPDVEMVVVFTGGAWNVAPSLAPVQYYDIIENHILPAIR